MREIKFRGKRIDTGEWIYGDLVHKAFNGTSKIIEVGIVEEGCYPVEVDPNSVGQFTWYHDKYGKEIYEKDILTLNPVDDEQNDVVVFRDGKFELKGFIEGMEASMFTLKNAVEFKENPPIIAGNECDNPELLEGN